ncbi:MAG TPA: type II secretion system protein [Candidatus Udaeobacter sp.]|nr:type II secretion system protein [Candidatus Udaeobacter sp.]
MPKFFVEFKINNRGLTLVEVLVAIGIFSFLILGVSALYLTSTRYNGIVWEQLKTQNEGRKVTQDFVNELRTASLSSIGGYPIESASTSSIVFYSNIDSDTLRERLRYFFSNRTLKKGVIKPTGTPLTYPSGNEVITVVAHDVANTSTNIFYYYDSAYSGAQASLPMPIDITKVRMVKITLQLDEDPHLTPVPFFIESKALLRNLKDN